MTVNTNQVKSTYTGNGVSPTHNLTIRPILDSDGNPTIKATHVVVATGVETDWVLDTDYSLDMTTFVVTALNGALPMGQKVVFTYNMPFKQPIDINNEGYYPERIEGGLDDKTLTDLQLKEEIGRAVKLPVGSDADPDELVSIVINSAASAAADAAEAEQARDEAVAAAADAQAAVGGVKISSADPLAVPLEHKIIAVAPLQIRKVTRKLDKIVEDNTTGFHVVRQDTDAGELSPSAPCFLQFKIKAAERQVIARIRDAGATTNLVQAIFDPATASVSTSVGGNGTGVTASMENIGGGEYLCKLSGTPNNTGSQVRGEFTLFNGSTSNYPGDNASGIYISDVQLAASDQAYQETEGAPGSVNKLYYSDNLNLWIKSLASVTSDAVDAPIGQAAEVELPSRISKPIYLFKSDALSAAATVALNLATGNFAHIVGSGQSISSFGTLPAGAELTLYFEGSNTIVHGANIDCPGSVNLSVVAGDIVRVTSEGAGVWRISGGMKNDGTPFVLRTSDVQVFTASGTWNKPAGFPATARVRIRGWGGGASGSNSVSGYNGGGGGGNFWEQWFALSELGASETVTVGAGGAGVANTIGQLGGNSTVGSLFTAYGGTNGGQGNGNVGGAGGTVFGRSASGRLTPALSLEVFSTQGYGATNGANDAKNGGLYNGGGAGNGYAGASVGAGSIWGGGGGGGGGSVTNAGGDSLYAGDGGTGNGVSPGTADGKVPAGGGGGIYGSTQKPGDGGRGQIEITVFL